MEIALFIIIVLVVLFIGGLAVAFDLKTQIGAEGRGNVLEKNFLLICESASVPVIGVLWNDIAAKDDRLYVISIFVVAAALFLNSVVAFVVVLRESEDALITEVLSDVRIIPAGCHNKSRKIEGTVNGKRIWFILRGDDKYLAEEIKKSNIRQVTVKYYPSSCRIESVKYKKGHGGMIDK
jgi:hypothetical protein